MILAFTYDVKTNSVYQHFGDTENFLLINLETKEKKVIDNGGYSHKELIPYLYEQGVNTIVCGGVGSPAVALFNAKGITVIPGIEGNVDEAFEKYLKGELKGDESVVHACGCNHW